MARRLVGVDKTDDIDLAEVDPTIEQLQGDSLEFIDTENLEELELKDAEVA